MKMKNYLLICLFAQFIIAETHGQVYHYKKIPLPVAPLAQQLDSNTNTDTLTVYELDDELFKEIVAHSEKEYHLLILYADWCKPCIEKMESIRSLASENRNVNFYYFSADKNRRIPVIADYMRRKGMVTPTFILSEDYKRNVKKRFIRFRDQVCSDCEDILGFPSFILFDKEMNVLYKNTAEMTELENYLESL